MNPNANFKVLGLQSDASWDEVKSAFRRLARTYHPDIAGPEGARKFAEITEAYMILKESISPGAEGGRATASRTQAPANACREATGSEGKGSIFKAFWKKLFSFSFTRKRRETEDQDAYDDVIPPARVRFLGSVISRAEAELHALLSRRSEIKARNRTDAVLRRIRSRHPAVVLLALQQITAKNCTDEIRRALIDHFKRNIPTTEVLESLLGLLGVTEQSGEFARVLAHHASNFSPTDAQMVLRWLKRQDFPAECYAAFLTHSSNAVVAAALNNWPMNKKLPEALDLLALLKKDDEVVLVPLLRLLKKERITPWAMHTVTKMASEHKSPVVRVWASAIVRDQNLS